MLNDPYTIRSAWQREKRAANSNINTFLKDFNQFYNNIRLRKHPSLSTYLRDPYGWAMLCKDYDMDLTYDRNCTCSDVWHMKGEKDSVEHPTYQGQFTFKQILNMLYRGYWFDFDKALNVYNNQHSAFSVFNQICNGRGYVQNRVRPDFKDVAQYMKHAFESEISLDENYPIRIPYIHRVCDGFVPPLIVMKHEPPYSLEHMKCHGYGEGLFLVDSNKTIVDVLRINDLWMCDLPLENRLKFATSCVEAEVKPYLKAWSIRSCFRVGRMLNAEPTNGLLIRGGREDFYNNYWFNWCATSLVYCYNVRGEMKSSSRGRSKPDWYTLEGDLGYIEPIEERTKEKIWLDDFDICEFRLILSL